MKVRFTIKNDSCDSSIYYEKEMSIIPRKGDLVHLPDDEERRMEKEAQTNKFNEYKRWTYSDDQINFEDCIWVYSVTFNLEHDIVWVEIDDNYSNWEE